MKLETAHSLNICFHIIRSGVMKRLTSILLYYKIKHHLSGLRKIFRVVVPQIFFVNQRLRNTALYQGWTRLQIRFTILMVVDVDCLLNVEFKRHATRLYFTRNWKSAFCVHSISIQFIVIYTKRSKAFLNYKSRSFHKIKCAC